MNYKTEKINGLNVHLLQTKKYKSISISLFFRNKIDRKTIAFRALLPNVLSAGCATYPSKRKISLAFEKLFSAKFSTGIRKPGINYIMKYDLNVLNDAYVSVKSSILEHSLYLLNEIIFNPLIEDDSFKESIIEEEKRLMIDQIKSIYDNKSLYSLTKLTKHMFEGELASITEEDLLDELNHINGKNLFEYYKRTILEDCVDIVFVGDLPENITSLIGTYFQFDARENQYDFIDYSEKEISLVKEIIESQTVKQGQLNIGYRTRVRVNTDQSIILNVFNIMLGGYANSRLFTEIREKESLCYSVYSSVDSYIGALYIKLGIEPKDYHVAKELVQKIMNELKSGNFTEEELEMAKEHIISNYYQSLDSASTLSSKVYTDSMFKREFDIERLPSKIQTVTKQDIINIAQKIELDTIYYLTNKEETDATI